MKIHKNSVFHNILALTLSNIGLHILGFIYRIFLSRMTGAEGMGVFQLVFPYYSVILAITLSGLTMAVSRLSAEYTAYGEHETARRVVSLSLFVFFVLFACVAVPTILFSDWISGTILGDSRTRISLLIILPCLFCTGFENIFKNYFFGIKYVKAPIISELTEHTVRILAVAAFLLSFRPKDAGVSATLIVCGMVVSEIVSAIFLSAFYNKSRKRSYTHSRIKTFPLLNKIASIAIPVSAAGLLNNFLSSANSVLIPRRLVVSGMDSSQAISSFGVLFGMTMPLLSLPIAFLASLTVVMVPKLSEGVAIYNMQDVRRKTSKAIHTTSLLSFPAIAVLIPLGSTACQLLYNQHGAGTYMLPLCIGTLFCYYQISTTAILNGIGQQRQAACFVVIGAVIQLVCTWMVGFPEIGIYGFIGGYILSSALMALLNFICIVRRLKLRIQWRNWFIIPMLSGILSGLVANFVFMCGKGGGLHSSFCLMLALGAACITYFCTLHMQGTSVVRYIKTLIPSQIQR